MAFSLVANTSASSSNRNGFTSGAIDTSGADFIVIALADLDFFTVGSLTDSKGNTWNALTRLEASSGDPGLRLYYAVAPTVGSGHTFTWTGNFTDAAMAVAAFSGANVSSPFDQQNGTAPTASPTSPQPGSITPSEDNELIIAALCWGVAESGSVSVNSSMTIANQVDAASPNHNGVALAYLVQTSLAAINPTWTSAIAQPKTAVIASFKVSGGGGGGGAFPHHYYQQMRAMAA
jgi:hypothetical protein